MPEMEPAYKSRLTMFSSLHLKSYRCAKRWRHVFSEVCVGEIGGREGCHLQCLPAQDQTQEVNYHTHRALLNLISWPCSH